MTVRLTQSATLVSRRSLLGAAATTTLALTACRRTVAPESSFIGTPAASPEPPGARGRWAGRTVTIATYGGDVESALRRLVWDPFERATGCRIRTFVNEPARAGTPEPIAATDLVLADPVVAARFAASGKGRPVDLTRVTGLPSDPARAAVGVAPAYAYSLVDCWRRDAFSRDSAPTDWTAWWDVQGVPGARALRRNPLGTLEIALLAAGVAPESLYPLDIDRALASLDQIGEAVGDRWWTRGIEPAGWIAADRAILAVAWHHRVIAAQWDGKAVDFGWSQGVLATDCWLAPAKAIEPEAADDLLAWTVSPEAQAVFARETRMGPVNPDAFRTIEPWLLDTLPTAEPQLATQVALDGAWWALHGSEADEAMASWLAGQPAARPVKATKP